MCSFYIFSLILPQSHHIFNFNCISSWASCLNSSTFSGFSAGNSSRDCTPKHRKNSSVVPKRIGLPGASSLPISLIRLYSINLLMACSQDTPRIFSISILVTGCLYATMDSVSDVHESGNV